jgi:ABC-type branched-subunit amino acid transport system ATPase component/ABC-type branched-subunit amino acid transport system permease subunit
VTARDDKRVEALAAEGARSEDGLGARLSGLCRTPSLPTVAKVVFVIALMVWPVAYKNLYWMSVMLNAGLFAMLTLAVGLVLGQAGQLSFGHSAFYGMGAYAAALLSYRLHWPTLAALVIAAIVPGVIALIIGRPVLKLRYFYLALATIGLGQIFTVILIQLPSVTRGINGLNGIPTLSILGFNVGSLIRQYYVIWVPTIVILLLLQRGLKYRLGRSLRALATSEIASATLGIRTANWKLQAFVVNAIICGLAGGLFAFVTGSISPGSFSFNIAVLPIVMALVGGAETIWGGVLGAIIMWWAINYFTSLQKYSGVAYSLIMILLLLFLPAGILGIHPTSRAWFKRLIRRETLTETAAVKPSGDAIDATAVRTATAPAIAAGGARSVTASAGSQPTEQRGELIGSGVLQEDLARPKSDARREGPILSIDTASIAFGGLRAVSDVSFDVKEGTITALIGPNGAGKTTLFNAISRQQGLSGGRISFNGVDLTKLSPANAARLGMARTFQGLRIFFNMSVLENVLVGCHRHERSGFWSCCLGFPRQRAEERRSRERAMDALALVGLLDVADKPAVSLPYGRQRLVEIARALASAPRLLMLDEPAAGMNASERADLVHKIATIRDAGVTVLLVEHDISLVMGISDTVNVLNYGRLIASGSPEAVKQDKGVIEAYLGTGHAAGAGVSAGEEGARTARSAEPEIALAVEDLVAAYGSIQALHGVSISVGKGEVVAVLGANGAGKTTLLNTICGIVRPLSGTVNYLGENITSVPAEKINSRGICQIPEGRQLFPTLTVEDNLLMGASGKHDWQKGYADDVAYVYELFPILGERRRQMAKTLSGGEQQMLAIGRGLMAQPSLLLLDEPSMGLAPLAVERIFDALGRLNSQGITMLMVEQNAEMALSLANRVAVIQTGSVVLSGESGQLRKDDRLRAAYLGGR